MGPHLLNPISNKNIGIMSSPIITITAENNFFTIGAKHRECIETFIPAYFFKSFPIDIRYVHVERKSPLAYS